MKNTILLLLLLFIPLFSFSQIIGGSGICLTDQAPTLTKDTLDCPLAYDVNSELIYVYQDSQWVVVSTGSCNLYDEVAWYVSKTNGDNSTVIKGNPCYPASDPWYVLRNLAESGDKIYIASGTYTYGASGPADATGTNEDITLMTKGLDVTIHCEDGVFFNQVNGTARYIFYADSTAFTTITGNAVFNDAYFKFEGSNASILDLSCKEIYSDNGISYVDDYTEEILINAEKFYTDGFYHTTNVDSTLSTLIINCDEIIHNNFYFLYLYNDPTAINFKMEIYANKFTTTGIYNYSTAFGSYYGLDINIITKEFIKNSSAYALFRHVSAVANDDVFFNLKADKSTINGMERIISGYGWQSGIGNAYITIDLGQCIVNSPTDCFNIQTNVGSATNRLFFKISGNYTIINNPNHFLFKRSPNGVNEITLEDITVRGNFSISPIYFETTSNKKGIVLKNATFIQQNAASPTIVSSNGTGHDLIIFDAYSNYGVTDPNINFPMDSLTVDSVYIR
jgi:hypothetical protein